MSNLDIIAEKAYYEYSVETGDNTPWYTLESSIQEAWRSVVRVVVTEAAKINAIRVLEDE